jgi:hypothetical protein
MIEIPGKYDSRSKYGTCKAAASCFIAAGFNKIFLVISG